MTPGGVEVKGAQQLEHLGAALKQADATLRQELRTNLRLATKPLTASIKDSLGRGLPHAGGLAAMWEKASIGTHIHAAGHDVDVRLEVENHGHDVTAVDSGTIRHLVYGRPPWVKQEVTAHLISDPFERGKPLAQAAVLRSMGKTADKITR